VRRYLEGVDVIINVPSITDHNLLGLWGAMANISLSLIRRPGRYLNGRPHEAVVDILSEKQVIPPTSLTLVNALRCVFDGGPGVQEPKVGYDYSVWASTDPVAIDRLATDWIDRQRNLHGLRSLAQQGRWPKYLDLAAEAELGVADMRSISRTTVRV
jgi:hypothetical protein